MFTLLLLLAGLVFGVPTAAAAETDVAAAIRARIPAGDLLPGGLGAEEEANLSRLYELGGYEALWTGKSGTPGANARRAVERLERAAADGLDPREYAWTWLQARSAALDRDPRTPECIADFDVTLSAAFLRYLRHLHMGRLDPRSIGFRLVVPAEGHDFAALLHAALRDGRVEETTDALAPPLEQYRLLARMLARYRALARDPALDSAPVFTGTVRPGDAYPALDALAWRLAALGDVAPDVAGRRQAMYDGPLVEGIRRFQVRHGLEPDGIIGTLTQSALRVPLAWRVRQIELALERLRWLPDLGGRRVIALNIPMFHLWAWNSIPAAAGPALNMRAIVGRAVSTETPVFVEEMRHVIFRPYWNVPRSIVRNEILPILRRDPDYLRRQTMEIVRGAGDDARPVAATAGNIELLAQGVLRLRQRPGPHNALGLVKFVFPNTENVYLHGTPAQALFARTRRDFSHGCVRLEDPAGLAEWVLGEDAAWTSERIRTAMAGPAPLRVDLKHPVQVVLFYVTAIVWPEDGTIRFADDLYRHDLRLDRALSRQE